MIETKEHHDARLEEKNKMTLSDKKVFVYGDYKEKDVKEFIKKLKETLIRNLEFNDAKAILWRLDKLVGDKLC